MSQQINPQLDVGGLTLSGLSAFSSILATLSTDGVSPVAMLQLEKLGTFFPVNGPKAARVSELLQRCNSVRLDRLSLAVGWRKGDSASLMSESAGGQAASLLCACIFSTFSDEDSGNILLYLSTRLLPPGGSIVNLSQLYYVGRILSSKLNALGFGTFLAEQTVRVCKIYEQLGIDIPPGILDRFSVDAVVEMLYNISRAVREPNLLVRITGTCGMGYIIAYILTLFPEDCLITVEGLVVYAGARQTIIIELSVSTGLVGPTQTFVEEILLRQPTTSLPIETTHSTICHSSYIGRFQWQRHVANQLHLQFTNVGLPGCSTEVLIASCDLLYSLSCWSEDICSHDYGDISLGSSPLPKGGLIPLLGEAPWHRIQMVLTEILGVSPTSPRKSLKHALSNFLHCLRKTTSVVPCTCLRCTSEGFMELGGRGQYECPKYSLWSTIEATLDGAIAAVFINPGENTTLEHAEYRFNILGEIIRKQRGDREIKSSYLNSKKLYAAFTDDGLAYVSKACVIYPTELATLRKCPDFRVSFELADGMLVFNGQYFKVLDVSSDLLQRSFAKKSLIYKATEIVPSSFGEHSKLTLSIREGLHSLKLGAIIHGSTQLVRLDLLSILSASISLTRTRSCKHPVDDPLKPEYLSKVLITSVFAPCPEDTKVGIVQVKSNPEAQLLSCELGVRCIFQSECCLTCAVEEALEEQSKKEYRISGRPTRTIIIAS